MSKRKKSSIIPLEDFNTQHMLTTEIKKLNTNIQKLCVCITELKNAINK
jgi:hypothetical protein